MHRVEIGYTDTVVEVVGPAGEYQFAFAAKGQYVVILGAARISDGNCQLITKPVFAAAFIDTAINDPSYDPVF